MSRHRITDAIRIRSDRTQDREHSSPLYLTSSFAFDDAEQMRATFADENDAYIYSRFSNPSVQEFTDRLCALEGAEDGFATASGMSAIVASFLTFLKNGDHLLCCNAIFGSTHTIITKYLPKYGIEYTYVDGSNPSSWEAAVKPNTRMFFLETPTNPGLDIIDLEAANQLAKKHNLIFNVDNCFATPIGQTPIDFGADLVVHSATKWIDGQGRVLGGMILGSETFISEHLHNFMRQTGPSLSPFNAWVLLKGLETLAVRVRAQSQSAAVIADALATHPKISRLIYPGRADHPQAATVKKQMRGGSTLIGFEVKGGKAGAFRALNALKIARISNNLGDAKSLVTHPATTTHQRLKPEERAQLGISEGFIRLSVGLEHHDDLIEDLAAALEKV